MSGRAATHEVPTVTYPSRLGTVVMDFPSNDLIDLLISVNFQNQSHLSTVLPPLTPECTQVNCSCVAGDARVEAAGRGTVAARDVVVGDALPGAAPGEWCRVVAVAAAGRGVVHGDFTADHLVVGARGVVAASGAGGGRARETDRVNIATACPAVRLASGALFTPLSTAFCARPLDWRSYGALYAAIARVVARTGAFWFDPSVYVDGGGGAVSWAAGLPAVCDAMTACAASGERCAAFEAAAARWIDAHVPAALRARVRRAYPRLGDAAAASGNLLADVRPRAWVRAVAALRTRRAAAALVAVCCCLLATAVARCRRGCAAPSVAPAASPG
ncbi:hypothetical protein STCU_11256 [Strigomonas culicis]|uniref:Uncharacterized protein n=1 Tax=Strigomonas culicis TaxID=28005 RepID=S9V0V5_9TRYP|nr:hypothetical protein STCU_11256 [Strigomonas culicis]|eukprot:EPY16445.1 hypothetical protein STCU_11256 [Strigomonas culicis]